MNITLPKLKMQSGKLFAFALLAATCAGLIWAIYRLLPDGHDFTGSFRPAALLLVSGKSPYTLRSFMNPPWTLIPLLPFAVLPARLGAAAWMVASLSIYAFIAVRLGAKPLSLILFLTSYPILYGSYYRQIDAIAALGFILPPQIGLFFIMMKPQIGAAIALFWMIEAWRVGGPKEVIRVFLPVSIAFLLSFLIFGFYLSKSELVIIMAHNASLWPWSIPIGVVLLITAIHRRRQGPAMIAGPFLSPYLGLHSYASALLGLLPDNLFLAAASISTWMVFIWGGRPG